MGSKKPKLALVSKEKAGSVADVALNDGLNLTSLDELNSTEKKRVEKIIAAACPKSGVLAVSRNRATWDLRPVVALGEEDGPSLVRLFGPDITFAPEVLARTEELLQRLARFSDLRSGMRDWGLSKNHLWYRRTLFPKTLTKDFGGSFGLSATQVFALLHALCEQLSEWHSHGVVHGHLVSSNVVYDGASEVTLLDGGVASAILQSAKDVPAEVLKTIAPEIFKSTELRPASDVYGLAQLTKRLLLALRKKSQFDSDRANIKSRCAAFDQILEQMSVPTPEDRPRLSEFVAVLDASDEAFDTEQEAAVEQTPRRTRGKLIKPGKILRSSNTAGTAEEIVASVSDEIEKENLFVEDPGSADLAAVFEDVEHEDDTNFGLDAVMNDESFASVSLSDDSEGKESGTRLDPQSDEAKGFGWFLAGLLVVLGVIYYVMRIAPFGYETIEYNVSELRQDWQSRIPSRMLTVAEVALDPDADNKSVQDLIVASANKGEQLPSVDVGLLRIAFDTRWEVELEPEDRRMAIAFGLARLLGENAPRDLGPLQERHPGILLAIAASAGPNLNRILSEIPVASLTRLPPPIGPAFIKLSQGAEDLSLADKAVQHLARFQSRGIERAEDLAVYLQDNTAVRLQALALLFSQDNYAAKTILEHLLNHPNIVLKHPEIVWARMWGLSKWEELEESDMLFVLAGAPPSTGVRTENIAKLFLHPNPQLRSYAIDQAINRVKFEHPGALEVLDKVRANPELVNAEQLARLAELLQDPENAAPKKVQALMASEPPTELLVPLLLSTRAQPKASRIDAWLALNLKSRGWEPSIAQLRNLSLHPDDYTRLFAYNKILRLEDEETARAFLETALEQEQKPDYREQLKKMIAQIGASE